MKNQSAAPRQLLAALAVSALAGCSSTPVNVASPEATVANNTGKALGSVNYQRCGGADSWSPVPRSALAPGATVTFTLPEACVNLNAYYADGKLAGQQRGIKREFPFNWVLY
jgi:hypothetical protein